MNIGSAPAGAAAGSSSSGSRAVDMLANCSAWASKDVASAASFADRTSIWASE